VAGVGGACAAATTGAVISTQDKASVRILMTGEP
jgi:hypothetical protein